MSDPLLEWKLKKSERVRSSSSSEMKEVNQKGIKQFGDIQQRLQGYKTMCYEKRIDLPLSVEGQVDWLVKVCACFKVTQQEGR